MPEDDKPDIFCEEVWNFWLRTWRSTLCGYGPSMVQVCHNAKSYASAKGLGPDFFWCCNFQFHSGIPKSEGKTPTDKDKMWNEHLVRVHLAAPPTWKTFRESWHLADGFWKNVGRLKKKWLKELVLSARCWVLIDTEPSLLVVSKTCIKITFITHNSSRFQISGLFPTELKTWGAGLDPI